MHPSVWVEQVWIRLARAVIASSRWPGSARGTLVLLSSFQVHKALDYGVVGNGDVEMADVEIQVHPSVWGGRLDVGVASLRGPGFAKCPRPTSTLTPLPIRQCHPKYPSIGGCRLRLSSYRHQRDVFCSKMPKYHDQPSHTRRSVPSSQPSSLSPIDSHATPQSRL